MVKIVAHKKLIRTGIFFLAVLLYLFNGHVQGQFYNGSQLQFGKSRIQYFDFSWHYQVYDEFDVYFYDENTQKLAEHLALYAPREIERIGRQLNAFLDVKMQFLVFRNLSDLKQSNVGIKTDDTYNIGGVTHIVGSQVFVYFNGTLADFERQIRAAIAQFYINQAVFGSSFTAQIKNSALKSIPEWFTGGLAGYVAEPWNATLDNRLRNAFLAGKFEYFNFIEGDDARLAGHSFWYFIATQYGEKVPGTVLQAISANRGIESALLLSLGLSLKQLMEQWYQFYLGLYLDEVEKYSFPSGAYVLKGRKNKARKRYSEVCISPDERYVAYAENEIGKIKVWIQSLENGKRQKILKYGWKADEKNDFHYPLLRWLPGTDRLAILYEHKGRLMLRFQQPGEKEFAEREMEHFSFVQDLNFAPDGKHMVLSAEKLGQSDLFLMNLASNIPQQITNDVWDDVCPVFYRKEDQLLFSSNRNSDSLASVGFPDVENKSLNPDMDLFLLDRNTKSLKRLTNSPGINEIKVQKWDKDHFVFLSDENGIYNRFMARIDSSISSVDTAVHYRYFLSSFAVSNYNTSILNQSINTNANIYAELVQEENNFRMLLKNKDAAALIDPVLLRPDWYRKQNPAERVSDTAETLASKPDSFPVRFRNVQFDELSRSFGSATGNSGGKVAIAAGKEQYMVDSAGLQLIQGKNLYLVKFTVDELVTQVDFNFINAQYQQFSGGGSPVYLDPGFNVFLKAGVSDVLQDYRITGGVRLAPDLKNNEWVLSYENIKHRLDKRLVFHRRALQESRSIYLIKQLSHALYYQLKWPFSTVFSVDGTAMLKNERTIYLPVNDISLKEPDENKNWAGLKASLTFDNTRGLGLNLYEGTRLKLFGEYYQLIDKSFENLVVLGFDVRNYLRIHRSFIWANRFACSSSLGSQRLIYYMGGVDRWLNAEFNQLTPIDYDQDYTYQTLATNMRGFDQNIRNGNSFAVINSELRFPLFRYFFRRPISSDVLNNFQLIGFGDVGTAWTGLNPYSDENALFTRWVRQGPLLIKVVEQKDPIVAGTGFGMRTRLLGYFVRTDLAWGYEDGQFNPPVFYFSLSLDF